MKIISKQRLKQLFEDTNRLPSSKFYELIDALWNPIVLFDEKILSEEDLPKIDDTDPLFDERYKFVKNIITSDSSYVAGVGFGNSFQADFAQIFGFGNTATSFAETIIGIFGTIATGQTADDWINTDRLLTIANGIDSTHRSDAVNIFKSGLVKLFNALVIGPYSNGNNSPVNGTLQFTILKGLEIYFNTEWHSIGLGTVYDEAVCQNGQAGESVFHPATFRDDLPLYASTLLFDDMTINWITT